MRMATVYVAEFGKTHGEEPFLTDVTTVEYGRDRLNVKDLYGRHKEVKGFVRKIDFVTSVVVIEKDKSPPEISVHGI